MSDRTIESLEASETMRAEIERLRAELAAHDWQPIETAKKRPENGQPVLYWFAPGNSWHIGTYDHPDQFGGRSGFCDHHDATHWMPLPKEPKP